MAILEKDQWQRKKQTKEEKRAAKRAKLDPDAYKSALDVHKEMERKRKRELSGESGGSDHDVLTEQPKEGLVESRKSLKKQKLNDLSNEEPKNTKHGEPDLENEAAQKVARAERRREKRAQKQAKKARKLAKTEAKRLRKQQETIGNHEVAENYQTPAQEKPNEDDETKDDDPISSNQLEHIEFNDAEEPNTIHSPSSRSLSPAIGTPTFSHSNGPSSASSTSSINPPSELETIIPSTAAAPTDSSLKYSTKDSKQSSSSSITPNATPAQANGEAGQTDGNETKTQGRVRQTYEKAPKLSPINQELLKERLAARIAALRAERKADGLDGKPARNRGELIEARRRKEEARRAHKKELRSKAKEQDAEAEAARLRGESGSPLWSSPGVFGPPKENNFAFGRVAFDDGTQLDPSINGTVDSMKKKGPQDPKTALDAAQRKHSRLSGLNAEKRANIEEKDRWLNAKKRAQGEKIKDDTSPAEEGAEEKTKGERTEREGVEGTRRWRTEEHRCQAGQEGGELGEEERRERCEEKRLQETIRTIKAEEETGIRGLVQDGC